MSSRLLVPSPLTIEAYAPFGDVVAADRPDIAAYAANQGSAARRDFVGAVHNHRPAARLNLAAFRCAPREPWPFPVVLLEKHPFSTQVFIPMQATRYIVLVTTGGEHPDVAQVQAFIVGANQGITYHPGIWHHPMIALDRPSDFACLVWEDGTPDDCVTVQLGSESFLLAEPAR